MFRIIFSFLAVLFVLSVPCHHAHANEFLDRSILLDDLNSGRWDALEQKLGTLQKQYENGDTNDAYIEHALDTFAHSSPQTLTGLNAWVEDRPDSAFAYAARGVHYWRIYWQGALNNSLNWDGSDRVFHAPEGFIYQGDELAKARVNFEKSISLNSKLATSYAYIISLAMFEKDQVAKGIAYRNAMNNVPTSDGVRWRYFFSLTPYWGGKKTNVKLEIKLADFFAKRRDHAGAPESFLTYFEAKQKGVRGGHTAKLKLFGQAMTETTRWFIGYDYADVLRRNKDFEGSIEIAKAQLKRYPQNPLIFDSIARANCNLERYEEAFEYWEKSAKFDPHDPEMLDFRAWCRIDWGLKIEDGRITTDITTAQQQYELALSDMQAAVLYAGNRRSIRYRRASILTYQLKRYEEALLDTEYLIALRPKNTSYLNLHSQVIFSLHDCNFKKLDIKLADLCQKGSCNKFQRDSANWRLSVAKKNGWCKG